MNNEEFFYHSFEDRLEAEQAEPDYFCKDCEEYHQIFLNCAQIQFKRLSFKEREKLLLESIGTVEKKLKEEKCLKNF